MAHTFVINIDRPSFEAARTRLASQGLEIKGDSGQLPEYDGVTVGFNYNANAGLLTMTTISKPALVPEFVVEKKVRNWIHPGIGAETQPPQSKPLTAADIQEPAEGESQTGTAEPEPEKDGIDATGKEAASEAGAESK